MLKAFLHNRDFFAGVDLLADASVDTTIAIHMLYHLADPTAGLKEMARVTREGGAVAVVLNPAGTMAELSALARAPQRYGPAI